MDKLPDIYIMSKFLKLPSIIKMYLPEGVKVVHVNDPDIDLNTYKMIEIPDRILEKLEKAEVLITDTTCLAYLLYRLPNIKLVQIARAGVEQVIDQLDPAKPLPKFTVTRYADRRLSALMSNYVLAQILNVERGLFDYHDKQKLKEWSKPNYSSNIRVLSELTIGILGAGTIGSAVGELLKSCGARVVAFVRNSRNGPSKCYEDATTDLISVLAVSDYFCNTLPSTKYTRGLLDNDMLKHCKKNSVFINIGRGDIIKNSSIVKALREGWISNAVLDVFEEEPLHPTDPLWNEPRVHVTPHIGALPNCEQIAKVAAANYLRYIKGEILLNIVDLESGY